VITREEIIEHIMAMKDGTDKTTPQPDYARAALIWYDELLPWLEIMAGVREAMKAKL